MLKKEIIISKDLVVMELDPREALDQESAGERVYAALKGQGLEPWSSIEVEAFTYGKGWLIIAKPVKVFIHKLLCDLMEQV